MKPVVAIVVEYRSPGRTLRCVKCLLEEGVERIIIVDNSDDGGTTFTALEAALSGEPKLHIDRSNSNLGFAAGVNRGLLLASQHSPGSKVLIINNDALPRSGLVKLLSGALEKDPTHLIAFPSLIHAGEPIQEVYYHRWFATLSAKPHLGSFRVPRGACMMVATDRLPGPLFDESFFMYGEEIALGWQLHHLPRALVHVSNAVALHEGSASSKLGSPFYEQRTAAAHILLTRRLATGPGQRALLAMIRTPAILLRGLFRSVSSFSVRPLAALYSAYCIARDVDRP